MITDQKNPLRKQSIATKLYYQYVNDASKRKGYEVVLIDRKWTKPITKVIEGNLTIGEYAARMFIYTLKTSSSYKIPELLDYHFKEYDGDKSEFIDYTIERIEGATIFEDDIFMKIYKMFAGKNTVEARNYTKALEWLNEKKSIIAKSNNQADKQVSKLKSSKTIDLSNCSDEEFKRLSELVELIKNTNPKWVSDKIDLIWFIHYAVKEGWMKFDCKSEGYKIGYDIFDLTFQPNFGTNISSNISGRKQLLPEHKNHLFNKLKASFENDMEHEDKIG